MRDDHVKALEVLRDPQTFKNTTSNNGKPSAEFGRTCADGMLVMAEVETAEDGAVSIKSIWKKVPGRNHVGAKPHAIRTSKTAAGDNSIIDSDSLLVNPATASKVVDPHTGEPLELYHSVPRDQSPSRPTQRRSPRRSRTRQKRRDARALTSLWAATHVTSGTTLMANAS